MTHQSPETIALKGWGITAVQTQRILNGESTINWKLDSEEESYVLRNAGKFGHYVRMQASLMQCLHESDFQYHSPNPIKALTNQEVVKVGGDHYLFYTYLTGEVGEYEGYNFTDLGMQLGAYHHASQDFDWRRFSQLRSKRLFSPDTINGHLATLGSGLMNSPMLNRAFAEQYGTFDELERDSGKALSDAERFSGSERTLVACHGDYSPDNVLSINREITGLIDFGGVTIDPKVTDVATCISRVAVRNAGYDRKVVSDVLAGYSRHSELDPRDEAILVPLAFLDTVRSLSWMIQETVSHPETRVKPESAVDYMHKAAVLRDTDTGIPTRRKR